MGDFECETPVKSLRKQKVCEMCKTTIPVGSPAIHTAQVFDGEFYSHTVHQDCREAWNWFYATCGFDDPVTWDIFEAFMAENFNEGIDLLNAARGYFPHVVNRIEFRMSKETSND